MSAAPVTYVYGQTGVAPGVKTAVYEVYLARVADPGCEAGAVASCASAGAAMKNDGLSALRGNGRLIQF